MTTVTAEGSAANTATKSAAELLQRLEDLGRAEQRQGMARFGIDTDRALGVAMPDIRSLAKGYKRQQALAEALWASGIHEARILATIVGAPKDITADTVDRWVTDIQSWDLCDQFCMNLVHKTPYAWDKIAEWSEDDRPFVRRAGFALIAVKAVHDKSAGDEDFIQCIQRIERFANDDRNFVKKAINWALRQIGKRNIALNQMAVDCAERLVHRTEKSAKWIGRDALRELTSDKIVSRLDRAARR